MKQNTHRRMFTFLLGLLCLVLCIPLAGCTADPVTEAMTIPSLANRHFYTSGQPGVQVPYFSQEMARWIQDPQPLQVYEASHDGLRPAFALPELDRSSKGQVSPDGKYLLVTTETEVLIYSAQTGRCLATRQDLAASHFVWLANNLLGVAWGQDQPNLQAVRLYRPDLTPALNLNFSTGYRDGQAVRFATGITYDTELERYLISFALPGDGANWGTLGLSLWSAQGERLVEVDTNIPCQTLATGNPPQQAMLLDSWRRVLLQGWDARNNTVQTYWFDLEKNQNQPIGTGAPLGLQEDTLLLASGELYSQTGSYVVTAYQLGENSFSMLFHLRDPALDDLNGQSFRISEMLPTQQEGVTYLRAVVWNQGLPYSALLEHHLGDKFSFQLLHVQPITHLLCGLTQAGEPLWISRSLSQDYGEQLAAQQSLENADLHVLLDQRIHPLSVGAVAPFDPKKGLDSQAVLGHLARYVSALLALDGQSVPKELVLSPEQVEELTRTLYGWSGFSDTESDCYDQEAQVYRLKGVDLSQEVQLRTVSKLPQFVEVGGSPACMLSYSYVDSDGETTLVEEVYFLSSFQQDAFVQGITRMVSTLPATGGSPSA